MRLRVAEARDAAEIAAIYAPLVRHTAISFELGPPDAHEMRRRLERILPDLPWLVSESAEGVEGYAYAAPHRTRPAYRWSVEVSVYVAETARRRGRGRALYLALLGLLEEQGFHRAYAGITLPNAASVALHEGLGFAAVGRYREVGWKHGAWHDVGWWERPLVEPGEPPHPPEAFASWREGEAGRRALAAL